MIVTLSSVGGAPGVTSWTLLLGAAWPQSDTDRVVLEADPAGGVLGARYGLGVDPGAVSLVASCRRDAGLDVGAHGRSVADGLIVVPSPELAETAHPVWVTGAGPLATALTLEERRWFIDLGRLGPGSPVADLASVAALNVVVVDAKPEMLVRVPARVAHLRSTGSSVGVLMVGSSGHSADELAEFVGADRLWVVPAVPDLPRFVSRAIVGGRARRHLLWRSARTIAQDAEALAVAAAVSRDVAAIGGRS